ncbi:ABC transporter substrate-binding protein, partial [Streptomyces sp. NPDC002104]
FKQGSIDGAWVPEPTASKLVSEGGTVLLDETSLWPDKKFVITNIIVSQKFLTEHADVVEAVLTGTVKTNAWINANPDKAKASANAKLAADSGKPLDAKVIDPAWPSILITNDPLAATLKTQSEWAVKAKLIEQPDLNGIYDLKILNKVLKTAGQPEVADAGLGAK